MSVGLFCDDDRTPPFHPQEKKNKTKQNRLTLICYDIHSSFFFSILIRFQPFSILGDAEVPSPKVGSFHMELQPTQIQQTTKDSEYESLI